MRAPEPFALPFPEYELPDRADDVVLPALPEEPDAECSTEASYGAYL